MAKTSTAFRSLGAALAIIGMVATSAVAAETGDKGLLGPWKASAEVSYVVTGGNTSTSAFSLGTSFTRKWTNDSLLFKTFILNSDSTTTTRTAQGTETDFEIVEEKVKRLVAQNYLLAGQYDRRISKKLLAQAGLSWDRNRFAGVDGRAAFNAGLGYAWVEGKRTQLKTDVSLTYTMRQYVSQDMESFAGFRTSLVATQNFNC